MARRGENIRKRKDGRWEGRYTILEVQSGRSVTRSVYARTYGEVKEKLSAAKTFSKAETEDKKSGIEICFSMVAEEWLSMVENNKKHATYWKYRSVYEKYLKRKLGDFSFVELEETDLTELFQAEEMDQISDCLRRSIYSVLNQILSYAAFYYHVKLFHLSCQKQKTEKRLVEALNQTEQSKLLQYLYEEMDIYKLGIIVCISTGLRLGEICALQWKDVDLKGKVLHVNATVQRIAMDGQDRKTILLEGEPKSIFSKREIPLSDEMVKLLLPYQNRGKKYVIQGNKPMEPRTYQNKFQKYLQMAGIEKKNFHILRHTFATNCINSGMDIKSLSEILGHSDVKITLNRYVHPTIEWKRRYMNSLSVIYGQYLGQSRCERADLVEEKALFRR